MNKQALSSVDLTPIMLKTPLDSFLSGTSTVLFVCLIS